MSQSANLSKRKVITFGLITCLIIFIFICAFSVTYLSTLGKKVTVLAPVQAFNYYIDYGHLEKSKESVEKSLTLWAAVSFLGLAVLFQRRKPKLFGDAKWATKKELIQNNLLGQEGIILGTFNNQYMMLPFDPMNFIMLYAPTRQWKGISFVIPNCLNYKYSLVVQDPKLENYKLTSGFRKKCGQDVYLLNLSPDDYQGHRWNPLGYLPEDINLCIEEIDNLAVMLIEQADGDSDIWVPEARSLFKGVVMYIQSTPDYPLTLGEVYRQLHPEQDPQEYFKGILEERHDLHSVCRNALNGFVTTPSKTAGGILSQLKSALTIFSNPIVDAVTSENDFDLRDLRKRKMTIYVGTKSRKLSRFSNLLKLFWQQLIDLNTDELPEENPELKHEALLLMDEFTAVGKLPVISKGVSYIAGYGLRLAPIFQSLAQLRETYGNDTADNLIDNHYVWISYRPRREKQAEELAGEIGYVTTVSTSKGDTKNKGKSDGSRSVNKNEAKRHLILPQEIRKMDIGESIILINGMNAIKGNKLQYFKRDEFNQRLLPPISLPAIEIVNHGTRGVSQADSEVYNFDVSNLDNIDVDRNQEVFTDEELDDVCQEFLESFK